MHNLENKVKKLKLGKSIAVNIPVTKENGEPEVGLADIGASGKLGSKSERKRNELKRILRTRPIIQLVSYLPMLT